MMNSYLKAMLSWQNSPSEILLRSQDKSPQQLEIIAKKRF